MKTRRRQSKTLSTRCKLDKLITVHLLPSDHGLSGAVRHPQDSRGDLHQHRTGCGRHVAVAGMHPGPHAVLHVIRVGRFTAEEYAAYRRLKALFDDSIVHHIILVFTHGDELEREGKRLADLMASPNTPKDLKQVFQECGHRCQLFNNNMASDQLFNNNMASDQLFNNNMASDQLFNNNMASDQLFNNNMASDPQPQVDELLAAVRRLVADNGGPEAGG